jgi:hypothetical protein
MADDEDIAALVIDNGSGMCKGTDFILFGQFRLDGFLNSRWGVGCDRLVWTKQ